MADEAEQMFVTWKNGDSKTQKIAFTEIARAINSIHPTVRSTNSNIYQNAYPPSISIRDEFSRSDYDYYRGCEKIPTSPKGKIKACMDAYEMPGNGIVRNIIDLMGDFAVQGIDIAHPKKKVEAFYKKWFFEVVNGPERSERFANLFGRTANVIVKRITAKIPLSYQKEMYRGIGGPDKEFENQEPIVVKKEIPCQYVFLHPMSVDVASEEVSLFVNSKTPMFKFNISTELANKIQYPKTDLDKELIKNIPKDMYDAIKAGKREILLDPNKVSSFYYKKDDWQTWAVPMTYSILPYLNELRKMHLADLSALDGAISQIRIWKLGSLEHQIYPTSAAINKLSQILVNNVAGGIMDLIWGPDLEFQEATTTLHQFLGEQKYVPVLNAIYAGLGIPPLFTGSTSQGSFTNNFLAIQTLIERLQYVRKALIKFWQTEIKLVQQAMGFDKPATLVFDRMTLNDESAILQILTNLVDRNIVSEEFMQESVGAVPEIEEFRIKRENGQRKSGRRHDKASPFHNANLRSELIKLLTQAGTITPSQAGLDLEPKAPDEVLPIEQKAKLEKKYAPKGVTGEGRPTNSKDKIKRKAKQVKPRRSVSGLFPNAFAWTKEAQDTIAEVLTPIYLESLGKKNLRQVSTEEFNDFENFKFNLLANIPYKQQEVNEPYLLELVKQELKTPSHITSLFNQAIADYKTKFHKEPTTDVIRWFQVSTCAMYNLDLEQENSSNSNNDISPVL